MINKFESLLKFFDENFNRSHSQALQDLFVIFFTNYIGKTGYFVEIGAADGQHFSNTLLLERIGWKGILVDPIDYDSSDLIRNSIKDKRCVYSESGLKLKFKEQSKLETPLDSKGPQTKEFSGLYNHLSDYAKKLTSGLTYEVETVSLNDLLEGYGAPTKIDYISIDTEGSEFEIIKNFNFNKYDVEIFTIEHNSASYREDIIKLLESKKYYRIPSGHFTPGFEDWYIKKDNPVLKKLGF
jgi:FkbM family methyltransferase